MEKRFENINEYKLALKLAKSDATLKLAVLKAKEKALGLVRIRLEKIEGEAIDARMENQEAFALVKEITSDWHDSL